MRLKRWAWMLALVLFTTSIVSARDIQQGDQCTIAADQTIEGNLFVLCRTLQLDGRVTGNLLGAATVVNLTGTVDGDVYVVAGDLDIQGTLGGDIHFAGPSLRVGESARLEADDADVISLSVSTHIPNGVTLPGSLISLSYQAMIDGAVGGEVNFWGSSLTINGSVAGDVDAQVGDASADVSQVETFLLPFNVDLNNPGLRIGETASIDGQLSYAGPSEAEIAEGAAVADPLYTPVLVQPDFAQIAPGEADNALGLYAGQVAREFVTLALIGVIALALMPRTLQAPLRMVQVRPLSSIGVGLLTFILSFPILLIVVLLSVLVVVALWLLQLRDLVFAGSGVLGFLNLGSASLFYFIAIFIGRVIVCLAVGRMVVRWLWGDMRGWRVLYVSLLAGTALLALVASLPVIGWVVNALAVFLGLGAIITLIQARLEAARVAAPPPSQYAVLVRHPDEPRLIPPPPPPVIDDSPRPLGMDNLPAGFRWWDDET
jgi:cytoskeletal protein CcmA (bactofilin family)